MPINWLTSSNLKGVYVRIPICPHRKYPRLSGASYEYLLLPFGPLLSPREFVKCTETAMGSVSECSVWVEMYIDDWLVAASSCQEAVDRTKLLTEHLLNVGFRMKLEKVFLLLVLYSPLYRLKSGKSHVMLVLRGRSQSTISWFTDLWGRHTVGSHRLHPGTFLLYWMPFWSHILNPWSQWTWKRYFKDSFIVVCLCQLNM